MKSTSYKKRLPAMILAGMMLFAAGGMSVYAAGAGHAASVSTSFAGNVDIPQSGETSTTTQTKSSQHTISDKKVQFFLSRAFDCLGEMESHAASMIDAATAKDVKKYKAESKAYAESQERYETVCNELKNNYTDEQIKLINEELNQRKNVSQKLYSKAQSIFSANVGEAEDSKGKSYSINKVKYNVQRISEGTVSGITSQALGSKARKGALYAFYKVTLRIGTSPAHLNTDQTVRVTRDVSNEIKGITPRLYQFESNGENNPTATQIIGLSQKKPWNFSVNVRDAETYFMIEYMPEKGRMQIPEGKDPVATDESGKKYTANDLRSMLVIADASEKETKRALKLANAKSESAAVYSVSLPEGVTLISGAMPTVELVCKNAADRHVTVSHIVKNTDQDAKEVPYLALTLGEYTCDSAGKLVFQTEGLGSFVIDWSDKSQDGTVSPSDASGSKAVVIWITVIAVAVAALGTAAFVFLRRK